MMPAAVASEFLTILMADGDEPRVLAAREVAAQHGARSAQVTAHGLRALFGSAVAAVGCAAAMQRATEGELRIGVDAGEPLLDGGEPRGRPVDVAAGLRDGAAPGEVLVSEVVRAVAAPRSDETLHPRGTMRLHGVPDPVAVAYVLWRAEEAAQVATPAAEARSISVVIADDQRLLRAGFRVILDAEPDITVVGEAGDGRAAVDVVLRRRPDVVLMDIRMPELDGLDAAERILSEPGLGTAVVMLTTFDANEYVYRALRIGASGFLLKDTPSERLLDAVRVAAEGDSLIAPSITRRLVEQFASAAAPARGVPGLDELTARELEVLQQLAHGRSNAEIAEALVLTENTVKTHVGHVLSKLGLRDRVQAVVLAHEAGLSRGGA